MFDRLVAGRAMKIGVHDDHVGPDMGAVTDLHGLVCGDRCAASLSRNIVSQCHENGARSSGQVRNHGSRCQPHAIAKAHLPTVRIDVRLAGKMRLLTHGDAGSQPAPCTHSTPPAADCHFERRMRAGMPPATWPGGMSPATTLPAAMIAPAPIRDPGSTVTRLRQAMHRLARSLPREAPMTAHPAVLRFRVSRCRR